MAQFSFVGVDRGGKEIKGQLEAASEGEVRMALRSQGVRPKKITKAGSSPSGASSLFGGKRGLSSISVPVSAAVLFTRQLQLLISSGIPLVQALEVLSEQSGHPKIRDVVAAIREKVSGGAYLWESMAGFPNVFPKLYVSLIRAGESSGSIDQMLRRLSKYLEDEDRLRRMIRSAMMYPIIVTIIGLVVTAIMLTFVIPKFEDLLKGSNQQLPGVTQFVIDFSHYFQRNGVYIFGGIGLAVYLLRRYFKTDEGRAVRDQVLFKVPIFGVLAQKSGIARFSRTLQTLLSSGVNLIDAIDICRTAADNAVIENAVGQIRGEVETGKTLGTILMKTSVFPKMATQMIMVGESTGNLDKSLEKIADFYESEVEVMVNGMTKLIEPIVLVVLGGLVGGLMIAMYLPVFKMAGAAG